MNSRNPNGLTLPHLSLQSPVVAEGEWWEGGSDSGEEIPEDEYDIGQLNLGAESPALEFAEPAIVAAGSGGNGAEISFEGDVVSTRSSQSSNSVEAGSSLADTSMTLGDSSVGSRLAAHAQAQQPISPAGRRTTVPRRRSWRSTGSALARESNNSANVQRTASTTAAPKQTRQSAADRDCGICFEYAVSPCRTLCCGKMFCKEHIVDWLHGPSSDGRCPACEKPCSVDKGVLSLASPAILPTASLSGRRKDSVSGNEKTSTRQRERSDTVVPSTSSFSTATTTTVTPTSPTVEHTRGRSPSRSLATRSMSAASSGSSSSASSSSNSTNSTTVPSEAESPITSEDDESTPPRYSKRPPPTLSRVSSNESGTPTPRGRSAVSDVIQPSAVPTIDSSESSIPTEAQIKSSWKADLAPVEAAPEPPLTSGGYTLEGLGRVTSAVGLTLILYVLFSR